jgi:hypothetical protein
MNTCKESFCKTLVTNQSFYAIQLNCCCEGKQPTKNEKVWPLDLPLNLLDFKIRVKHEYICNNLQCLSSVPLYSSGFRASTRHTYAHARQVNNSRAIPLIDEPEHVAISSSREG